MTGREQNTHITDFNLLLTVALSRDMGLCDCALPLLNAAKSFVRAGRPRCWGGWPFAFIRENSSSAVGSVTRLAVSSLV